MENQINDKKVGWYSSTLWIKFWQRKFVVLPPSENIEVWGEPPQIVNHIVLFIKVWSTVLNKWQVLKFKTEILTSQVSEEWCVRSGDG